jgi:hypothetical protein
MTHRSLLPPRSLPRSPRSRRRGAAGAGLLALFALAGCGGAGSARGPSEPFVAEFPNEGPGGGGTPATPLPPVAGPRPALWEPDAFAFSRVATFGSFPPDLVLFEDTLFTVDADAVESEGARIVALHAGLSGPSPSPRFRPTVVRAEDLVDSDGAPGDVGNPIAFGAFLNDLLVVSEDLAFVLANAGGSDSAPTLSNAVAFDPRSGTIRQVVDLAQPFTAGETLLDSTGAPVPGNAFVQAGAEGLEFVPLPGGRGLLYVAMSNFVVGAPSFGSVKYPGTVEVWEVDLGSTQPVVGPAPLRTHRTSGWNAVAVSRWTGIPGVERVLVTVGGATAFDASFRLVPVTEASIEVLDGKTSALLGTYVLGLAGLSASRPALGRDAAGHAVGYFPSSVTGEVYSIRLDGLATSPVDPSRVAVLRGPGDGIAVTADAAGGPGGNVAGVALSASGRTLFVSGFGDLFAFPEPRPGRLFAVSLPIDVVAERRFGAPLVPGTANLATEPGRTLGPLVVMPGIWGPDAYVVVGGTVDTSSFLGSGPASIGAVTTFGLVR